MLSSSKVLTARVGCPLGKKTDDIFSYINLFPPTVVAMEVMSRVARYLKFIVGADLLSKFQCNETAVTFRCTNVHGRSHQLHADLAVWAGV